MKIVIEDYKPCWKELFIKEKELLLEILSEVADIEHIGSTSVENLGAKPVIDIMVGVKDFSNVEKHIRELEESGYKYIPKFDYIMPFRCFLAKEKDELRTHHIHMVVKDSEFWFEHILFRDYLRKNEEARESYYNLKKELSLRDWKDRNDYADVKADFIREICDKAMEEAGLKNKFRRTDKVLSTTHG